MGRVSIWTQWLIVAAGLVLFPLFMLLATCLIGWFRLRPFWRPRLGMCAR
jgi:hypothetical protein